LGTVGRWVELCLLVPHLWGDKLDQKECMDMSEKEGAGKRTPPTVQKSE